MTQTSLSFSLVLKWLVSICTFICHFFLKLRGTLSRVWTNVYLNYVSMHSMFMFGYVYA
jgi:hypothetical protein